MIAQWLWKGREELEYLNAILCANHFLIFAEFILLEAFPKIILLPNVLIKLKSLTPLLFFLLCSIISIWIWYKKKNRLGEYIISLLWDTVNSMCLPNWRWTSPTGTWKQEHGIKEGDQGCVEGLGSQENIDRGWNCGWGWHHRVCW